MDGGFCALNLMIMSVFQYSVDDSLTGKAGSTIGLVSTSADNQDLFYPLLPSDTKAKNQEL